MGKKRFFEAVATLVGCTIGAGILGIPYVFAKAGFLTGLLTMAGVFLMFLLIHLYLGEVVLRTKGKHQLTFYAGKYLGKPGRYAMFLATVLGIYGAIIAYIMGAGEALASITGINPLLCSLVFFAVFSFIVYLGLEAIERSEAIAFPFVMGIVVLIVAFALFKVRPENLFVFKPGLIFLPYGILMFAFMGTSAIPEMREVLASQKHLLKKAILIGTIIPLAVYILFTLAIVGVLDGNTNEVGSVGISAIMGNSLSFIGGLFAFLTMTTSFMVLGLTLKELFWYDYSLHKNTSWILACIVPFLIFFVLKISGLASFSRVLDLTGTITGILTGVLIILMALHAKEKGERKPEYSIFINGFLAYLFIGLLLLGGILKVIY